MLKLLVRQRGVKSTSIVSVLLISQLSISAQKMAFLNKSTYNSPLFICIVSENLYNDFFEKAQQNHNLSNHSFLVINGNGITVNEIKDNVNGILNSDAIFISKNNVYWGIVGDSNFFDRFDVFTNDFFPSQFYLSTDDNPADRENFEVFKYADIPLTEVLEIMKDRYLWEIDRLHIQEKYRSDYHLSKVERGIGLGMSLYNPNALRYEAFAPSSFITYGITGYRRINRDWKIYGNLFINFKIPNMEKIMQEEMQGQIDMSSISSGNNVRVNVNTDIQARMYLNLNLEARKYLFTNHQKIKPFVGAGVSYCFLMNMKGTIDTTITVNPSSMSGGGGSFGGSGFFNMEEADNDDINSINSRSFGLLFSTGFEYPLNNYTLFNTKLAYHMPVNTFNQSIATVNGLDLQFGLVFKLNGKKIRFVEYMRTR